MLHDPNVAKVSIVGVGIRSNPGARRDHVQGTGDARINLIAVSASEIKSAP
jgi:aspartate kinase